MKSVAVDRVLLCLLLPLIAVVCLTAYLALAVTSKLRSSKRTLAG